MRVFYAERSAFHLRAIARKTGLEGQSITRHLDLLEKEHYLMSRKEGNLRKYAIRPSSKTFALFTLFDIERFGRLPSPRRLAIETYLAGLPRQPVYAILFGSTAKGTHDERSDIDMLLIANENIETAGAENEADALHAQSISTFQMAYDAFLRELRLREDAVVQSALKTGYPLINHISYYGALCHERV